MRRKYKGQVCAKNNEKKEVVGLPGIEQGPHAYQACALTV